MAESLRATIRPREPLGEMLFRVAPDPHVLVDARARILDSNLAFTRLTGWTRDELVHRRVVELAPAWRSSVLRPMLRQLRSHGLAEHAGLELQRADSSWMTVSILAAALPNESGAWRAVVLLRDESERLEYERQIREADRLALTGRLAASVAHEVSNPLQSILNYLQIIDRALPPDFSEREAWNKIGSAVDRLRQVVCDLLDLHRGDEHQPTAVDLNRVVAEALGLLQPQLDQCQIRVVRELSSAAPRALAVERHVFQVIINLLLNALDAMPHSGLLTVRTRVATEEVHLDICDSGEGIPSERLPSIFEPFVSASARAGTGLGLFVTYNLVRQHGGRIGVDSLPGRGTIFRVSWPT